MHERQARRAARIASFPGFRKAYRGKWSYGAGFDSKFEFGKFALSFAHSHSNSHCIRTFEMALPFVIEMAIQFEFEFASEFYVDSRCHCHVHSRCHSHVRIGHSHIRIGIGIGIAMALALA